MKKTFDNEKFIRFSEKYATTTIINARYGVMSGSEDLSQFISMVKLYRVYLRNFDAYQEKNGFKKNIYHLVEIGENELFQNLRKQASVVVNKSMYLNMWARKNAEPFIVRKVESCESPIDLANELVATLYLPALCL